MPESRFRRLLSALLPGEVRRNVFEPALHDLDGERVREGRGRARLAALLLFMDCWRLAPAEVFSMFTHDLRHAFRLLRRDPGFTITAVLTLTLGVGANVAVFAVVNALLLRPLPYADADRLMLVEHRDRRTGITKEFIAMGDYVDLHARQTAFESIAVYGNGRTVVYLNNEPIDVASLGASAELLSTLRVVPVAGRTIQADDGKQGAAPVVMLGYSFWKQQLGGDPTIVGRSIRIGLNPLMRQVIGIAPPGFRFPASAQTDVIFPLTTPAQAPAQRKNGWTFAAARLKPGVTREQATIELTALSRQMEQENPTQNQGSEYFVVSIRDAMVGDTRSALVLLLAAVGLVLLIACANVANLLAARSLGRRQEMSIRVALGAGRGRIIVQLLAESVALAVLAGTCAVLFARWAIPALVGLIPSSVSLAAPDSIRIDATVLLFAAVISLITTIAFSLFSALGFRRDHTAGTLVSPGRVTTGTAVRRATSTLVAAEIALALVLLTGAGLVLRSFSNLLSVDPGFSTVGVLTADFAAPFDRYRETGARVALHQRMFEAIRQIPGVEAVGVAAVTPLTGNNWTVPFDRADRPVPAGQRPPDVGWQSATGGYFRALNIPLRAGRLFAAQDGPAGPPVVIISEAIQDQFFRGETAVGHKVKLGDGEAEIVGVVGNIRRAALTDAPRMDMYFPQEHEPSNGSTLFVRTSGDPAQLGPALRSALRGVEPAMLLRSIRSMDEITRESVEVTRLALSLLGAFAVAAIALAAVGIYGVMSYVVRQRMREIGTRMALGATPGGILWLVLGHGARIAVAGTLIGLAASFAAGRALQTLLFGTSPSDPKILLAAAGLLLATALAACYFPARRATRVDPVKTLAAQ
jgi:putative ABC transport system permease protein